MDAELLRGLVAELRAELHSHNGAYAYTQYEKGRVDEKKRNLARIEAALSMAQGQGSILPDAYMTADGRYVDPTIADQFPGAVPLYSYPPRYAAPAQPDGVGK